jgi:hypothetical protein
MFAPRGKIGGQRIAHIVQRQLKVTAPVETVRRWDHVQRRQQGDEVGWVLAVYGIGKAGERRD